MANFKRGQRVRYTAGHVGSLAGKLGTVTGIDSSGWVRVRFDHQQSYEKGTECSESSLELYDGSETQTDQRKFEESFTAAQWQIIADAMTQRCIEKPSEEVNHVHGLVCARAKYAKTLSERR